MQIYRHNAGKKLQKKLPQNRWGLECVANLDKLPVKGAMLVVGAPKMRGGTGGPSRVMALS